MRAIGEESFADYLISRIETDAVYLTIDKDALTREDAITNWDQGRLHLPYLLSIIRGIGRHHRIIGADVVGDYSKPSYSGSLRKRASKHYECLKDRPYWKRDGQGAPTINSATNHALLNALSEAMA
jgi:hypothetical protein